MVPVERRVKTPDVQCLHDATVVPIRDSRREDRKIAGPEVVTMLVCVCHDGRFGRSRPGKHRRGKVLFQSRFRCSLRLAHVRSVLFARSTVRTTAREVINNSGRFLGR